MSKSVAYPLFIIGILFFVFGFITWANGVLIPYFRVGLELSNFQSTLVAFSAYVAYFFMAIPSAWILKQTGYKKGMFIGLLVMAVGTLLFVPAAYSRAYWLFLTGLFITGTGLALLQTAANPYVAVIGPIESTAKRIGFMGLANKIAGLVSLAALGSLFLATADEVVEQLSQATNEAKQAILNDYMLEVVNPYLVITAILVSLAFMIYFSKLPEVNESADESEVVSVHAKQSVFQFPNLVFGIVALFFSSACEVIPIDGIILYSSALGIPIAESRFFAQYTLIAMTFGYVASIFLIPKYLSQQSALLACAVWGMLMTFGSYVTEGITSVSFVVSMGFSSAMLWGTIWGLALTGLGRFTKMGSALLLMSVVGGGIFPVIFGRLMDINLANPQYAMLLLIPCNLILMGYALWVQKKYRMSASKAIGTVAVVLLVLFSGPLIAASHPPVLLPQPQSVDYRSGKVYVGQAVHFVSKLEKSDQDVLSALQRLFDEQDGGTVVLSDTRLSGKGIEFHRTGSPDPLPGIDEQAGRGHREYYRMEAKGNLIRIESPSSAGLFYAVQTLRQLVSRDDKGVFIPEVVIEDWPAMPYRGFMMDMTHMQLPTMDEIKEQIDFMARWKYNQYYFYSETNIELDGYPLLAPNARFTKKQIQEIIDYGRERFIDIVPNLNLYGHLHDFFKFEHYSDLAATPYGREFKTDHPEVEGIINDWVDQFSILFPSPFFHIGFDETYLIQYEAERLGIATDELYLNMLNRTIAQVEQKGKKVMFYADRLQMHPEGISKVEGDPIVIAWHYYLRPPFENGYDEALQPFADHDLPVFVQSATLNWRWLYPDTDLSFENNALLTGSAKKVGSRGYIMSAWTDSWSALTRQARPDIAHGAMVSWQTDTLERDDFFHRYCHIQYPAPVAELVKEAHLALAESAKLTRDLYWHTSDVVWEDPFSEKALEIYFSRKDEIRRARLLSEKAQVYLREAMESDIDRVTLFSMFAGAKLLDYLTAKHLFAGRVADLHAEYKETREKRKFHMLMVEATSFFSSLSVDMHDMIVEAKAIFREAWLNEYTDYRLEIAMARFDRELHNWFSVQKKLRRLHTDFEENEPLPSLQGFLDIDWD